jgi:hypothetical protein
MTRLGVVDSTSPLLYKVIGIYQIFIARFKQKNPELIETILKMFVTGTILDQKQ